MGCSCLLSCPLSEDSQRFSTAQASRDALQCRLETLVCMRVRRLNWSILPYPSNSVGLGHIGRMPQDKSFTNSNDRIMSTTAKTFATIALIAIFLLLNGALQANSGPGGGSPGIIGLILLVGLVAAIRAVWRRPKSEPADHDDSTSLKKD